MESLGADPGVVNAMEHTRVFTCGPCHAEFILSWWRHRMETFSATRALCGGNSPVTGEFPAQIPVTWSFDVFSDLRLFNGWVDNREAGDLRRQCAYNDVIVMEI